MTSLQQIEANRRNALKSTGPTTSEGKERSSRNAVRHGLTAETVVGALESSSDYELFEAAIISDYSPETAVGRQLALRLASVLWRLRRATSIETAIFDSATENGCSFGSAKSKDTGDQNTTMADGYLKISAMPSFPLDRLNRYETSLRRQARQIIFTIEFLRRHKREPKRISFPFPFRRRDENHCR